MKIIPFAKFVFAKGLKKLLSPPALRDCNIDRTAKIGPASELTNCSIGRYSYVGSYCFMVNAQIGSFCSIADRCSIGGATHRMDYVSTSPVFNAGKNILNKNFASLPRTRTPQTVIGDDVWIGQGAFLKAGIVVGPGAVIGMGAVVTKNIGAYEVWAGNPARMIKNRFSDEEIEKLLQSEWWLLPENELGQVSCSMDNVQEFVSRVSGFERK